MSSSARNSVKTMKTMLLLSMSYEGTCIINLLSLLIRAHNATLLKVPPHIQNLKLLLLEVPE